MIDFDVNYQKPFDNPLEFEKAKYRLIYTIIKDIKLKEKKEMVYGYHGSRKGDEWEATYYYDPYRNEWTVKDFAIQGHIIKELSPIINDIIKVMDNK